MTCSILIQVAYVGLTDDPPNLEGYFSVFYGCQESYEMNVLHFYMLVCHLTGSFRIGSLSTYNGDGAPGTNLGVVPKNISRDSHIPSLFNRFFHNGNNNRIANIRVFFSIPANHLVRAQKVTSFTVESQKF